MAYSDNEKMVRVDFFKVNDAGGFKWAHTEAMEWVDYNSDDIKLTFHESIRKIRHPLRLAGLVAVCLEPYHQHSHPVMIQL